MTPIEIITIIYPSMATSENADGYITLAENMTSRTFFGVNYSFAVALRACHMFYTATVRKGKSGYLSHESSGTLSRTYGGISGNTNDLLSSSYGSQLVDLINSGSQRGLITSIYIQNLFLTE